MADDEDFVVERVLDKRVGRSGKVIYILVKEQWEHKCVLSG